MSVKFVMSEKKPGISPDKSLFDKSLHIKEKIIIWYTISYTFKFIIVYSDAYSSLNCVSLDISDVMVPLKLLPLKFLIDNPRVRTCEKKTETKELRWTSKTYNDMIRGGSETG